MFGKLREKLKKSLSVFSKKTEEEAEIKEKVVEITEEPKEEKKTSEPVKGKKIKENINGVKITYFVHGTTTDNEKSLATGWAQGELSELGVEQAKKLKELTKEKDFDLVFCSDLKRAVDSANFAFGDKYKIISDKRIRECNYGDWNENKKDWAIKDYIKKKYPNGESYLDVEKRVADFLNYLFENYYGQHIAIMSHQAPQLAMDVLLKSKSWEQAIKEDWRKQKAWQPGWVYEIREKIVSKEPTSSENLIQKNNEQEELEEVSEEALEKLDEEIEKSNDFKEVPTEYDVAKQKYEPDLDEIKEITQAEQPLTSEDLVKETKKKYGEKKEKPEEVMPSAEELINETKEKFAEEELPKEKRTPKPKEPTAQDLLDEDKNFSNQEEGKEEPKKKSFFGKIKETLTTKTISEEKYEDLFWDLELVLLENNVSIEVIEKIKEDLKEELVGKPLPRDVLSKIEETLKKTLNEILTFEKIDLLEEAKVKKPLIITFFGINGTGKTTSIAKLTHYFKEHGLSVVLAACDTFRAAAIQQLEEHAHNLNVKIIKHDYGSDAAAVAFDAVKYAENNDVDVVLIDTAGRLHSNTNLMAELEKIIRVVKPDFKIFVGESITGNDCIEQAKKFNELVEMDGAILTKADVDDKGGAPLSISYTIKKPVLFLGMGQEYKDLEEFDKEKVLSRLF